MNNNLHRGRLPLVAACDIESTLTPVEGWDFLAQMATKEIQEQVVRLTNEGMNGEGLSFEECLRARFNLLKHLLEPGREGMRMLQQEYIKRINPDVLTLIALLRKKFQRVVCISGGLQDAISPFTEKIGIARGDLFSIALTAQRQLPDHHPLYANDGKKKILDRIIDEEKAKRTQQTRDGFYNIMIGDGMTDAATRGEEVIFIAVGNRKKVIATADFHAQSLNKISTLVNQAPSKSLW